MAQITKLLWFVFALIYPIMITRLVLASAKTPTTSLLGRLVYVQRATNGMELPAYHAHIPASPVPIPTFVVIVSMGTFSRMTEHAHRLQQIFLDCFKMLMETLTNAVWEDVLLAVIVQLALTVRMDTTLIVMNVCLAAHLAKLVIVGDAHPAMMDTMRIQLHAWLAKTNA